MQNLIGKTPMIKIKYEYKDREQEIYTKLEYFNLTGSIKDRVVQHIIKKAIRENKLNKDTILVEATSGNTGISLAAIGAKFGNKVEIFMPDWVSEERKEILKIYGAYIHLVSKKEGRIYKMLRISKGICKEKQCFFNKSVR